MEEPHCRTNSKTISRHHHTPTLMLHRLHRLNRLHSTTSHLPDSKHHNTNRIINRRHHSTNRRHLSSTNKPLLNMLKLTNPEEAYLFQLTMHKMPYMVKKNKMDKRQEILRKVELEQSFGD
jgi:hypothetical protein